MIDTEGNCQECLTHSQVPRWWLTHSSLYMKNVLKKKKKNQTSVQVLMDPHPAEWLTLRLLSPLRLRSVNGTFVSPNSSVSARGLFPRAVLTTHTLHSCLFDSTRHSYSERNETGLQWLSQRKFEPL